MTGSTFVLNGRQYRSGDRIKAHVVKVLPFGVLVQLHDGTEGVIRRRELSWERDLADEDVVGIVSEDQEIDVIVLELDEKYQRLMLSLRRAAYDPWSLLQRTPGRWPGSIVRGEVVSLQPYGAFVELEDPRSAVGLVHVSQVPGSQEKEIGDILWVGDRVEAVITKIQPADRKLSLSITGRLSQPRHSGGPKQSPRGLQDLLTGQDEDGEGGGTKWNDSAIEIAAVRKTGNIQKILVVDDDQDFVDAFRDLLEKLEYSTDGAGTGEEGAARGATAEYDLIFVDLNLPDMSGIEVAWRILTDRADAKIALVTGLDWIDRDVNIEELTLVATILKPLDSTEVVQLLQTLETGHPTQTTAWTRTMDQGDEFLQRILRPVEAGGSLQEKLGMLLEEVRQAIHAEASIIFRWDTISRDVSVFAHRGSMTLHESELVNLQYSPVKDVAWQGKTEFQNNVTRDAPTRFGYLLCFALFESCLGLPLVTDEKSGCYALFLLDSKPNHFTEDHRRLATWAAKGIEYAIKQDRLETLIQSQQRLILAGQLGLSLVHESNNKLAALAQFTRNLQYDHKQALLEPVALRESHFSQQLERSMERLLNLSQDLIELNRSFLGLMKSTEHKIVDINHTILDLRTVLTPLIRKQRIRIETDLDTHVPLTRSVPLRLEQVFLNLMLNGVQHTVPAYVGGRQPELHVTTSYEPGAGSLPIKVRVRDEGSGIHRQRFEWVFELGTSTREGGSGLGLFLSKGLTESLGGRLSVEESIMFVGTTFLVELPLVPLEED